MLSCSSSVHHDPSYLVLGGESRVVQHVLPVVLILIAVARLHKLVPRLHVHHPQPACRLVLLTLQLQGGQHTGRAYYRLTENNTCLLTLLLVSISVKVQNEEYLVVGFGVIKQKLEVCGEMIHLLVILQFEFLLDLCHIDRLGDHFIVVRLIPKINTGSQACISIRQIRLNMNFRK